MIVTAPATPGQITGPASVCASATVDFSISEVQGSTSYEWTVPTDAIILNGQGTTSVTVQWGGNPGDITVNSQNFCGKSDPSIKSIGIEVLPVAPGPITGKDSVCKSHTGYQYNVAEVTGAQGYVWTLPTGASIASGEGTNNITVDFSAAATTGDISVYAVNTCGNGPAVSKNIIVSDCAGISKNELNSHVLIYPNPANSELFVSIKGKERQLDLSIVDIHGKAVYKETLSDITYDYTKKIDISRLAKGLYLIRLSNDGKEFQTKFVVQ
jgi:hypothetical protein